MNPRHLLSTALSVAYLLDTAGINDAEVTVSSDGRDLFVINAVSSNLQVPRIHNDIDRYARVSSLIPHSSVLVTVSYQPAYSGSSVSVALVAQFSSSAEFDDLLTSESFDESEHVSIPTYSKYRLDDLLDDSASATLVIGQGRRINIFQPVSVTVRLERGQYEVVGDE